MLRLRVALEAVANRKNDPCLPGIHEPCSIHYRFGFGVVNAQVPGQPPRYIVLDTQSRGNLIVLFDAAEVSFKGQGPYAGFLSNSC